MTKRILIVFLCLWWLAPRPDLFALSQGMNDEASEVPHFIVEEVRELIRYLRPEFSEEHLTAQVRAFCKGVVFIQDLDAFLDAKGVRDKLHREEIHKKAAFTINETWPIHINAKEPVVEQARRSERGSPGRGRLRGIIYHELWHANGEKDEARAIEEEIRFLETLVPGGSVDVAWIDYRRLKLGAIAGRKDHRKPMVIDTQKYR